MIVEFESKEKMFESLCSKIIEDLKEANNSNGTATLLVSGGSTPKPLFQLLNQCELDWEKVTVGLVDERYVNNTSEFSNENLVCNNLITNFAKKATFVPMVFNSEDENLNLEMVKKSYKVFENPTVVLLGMGDDGHTASIFPNDEASNLANSTSELIAITNAPNHPKRRITCSTSLLKNAKHTYLLFTGENKKVVLEEAKDKKYPIGEFLNSIEAVYFTK
jgi:6-phosphogluconolactonase